MARQTKTFPPNTVCIVCLNDRGAADCPELCLSNLPHAWNPAAITLQVDTIEESQPKQNTPQQKSLFDATENNKQENKAKSTGAKEGRRRRDEALESLQVKRARYINQARRKFLEHLLASGTAAISDVLNAESLEVPAEIDKRYLGQVPRPFLRAGIIRRAGFKQCEQASQHATPVAVWEMADPQAARDWLASLEGNGDD